MSTVRIETLGCRLNQIESEAAASLFINQGFDVKMEGVTASSQSDDLTFLVIINTCAVTQKAEQKARRLIRLILKKYKNAAVLVTGCYAQLSRNEIEKIDRRIVVLGGQVKSRLSKVPQILKEFSQSEFDCGSFINKIKGDVISLPVIKPDFPEDSFKLSATTMIAHSRASLKIQDGCNNSCSYCTIHIARGHSVSLDVKTAVERVLAFEKQGYDEVVITSINIAQYKGLYQDENGQQQYFNFAQLLEKLIADTQKINFRISSLYPEIVDQEFCKIIAHKRVRPHFHISVQSGSDRILGLMNRVYKSQQVVDACEKIRAVKPEAFIACDIITGFPGETIQDFEQTLQLCERCNFSWIHAFPFSERPGTPACKMKNKVPQSESQKRARQLTQWAIGQKIKYIQKFIGQELTAVVEKKVSDQPNLYHCMTENFIHCQFVSDSPLEINKEIKIRIIKPLKEKITKGGEIEAEAQVF